MSSNFANMVFTRAVTEISSQISVLRLRMRNMSLLSGREVHKIDKAGYWNLDDWFAEL